MVSYTAVVVASVVAGGLAAGGSCAAGGLPAPMATTTAAMSRRGASSPLAPAPHVLLRTQTRYTPVCAGGNVTATVTRLFEREGVAAIRALEKKKRQQIYEKDEEMKETVGARYRDIIESADSIASMQRCCRDILGAVASMDSACAGLQTASAAGAPVDNQPQSQGADLDELVEIGKTVKHILEAPGHVHACLDAGRLLDASIRFHSTQAAYLGLEANPQLALFPWLPDHWNEVQHLPSVIADTCRGQIRQNGLTGMEYAEALSALMLSDRISSEAALSLLMDEAKQWVASSLTCLGDMPSDVPTGQLCDAVSALSQSITAGICVVYAAFITESQSGDKPAVERLVQNSTDSIDAVVSNQYLPLSADTICCACSGWVLDLQTLMLSADSWLQCAHTVSDLHMLSCAVESGITAAIGSTQVEKEWQQIWCSILGSTELQASAWAAVFERPFAVRAKEIVVAALDLGNFHTEIVDPWLQSIQNNTTNDDSASNIGHYMWTQQRVIAGKSESGFSVGGIDAVEKTNNLGQSRDIQQICTRFSQMLRNAVEDINHADSDPILTGLTQLLRDLFKESIQKWTKSVDKSIVSLRNNSHTCKSAEQFQIVGPLTLDSNKCAKTAVALGRLLISLANSEGLQLILGGSDNSTELESIKQDIMSQSNFAMSIWVDSVISNTVSALQDVDCSASGSVYTSQRRGWQEISMSNADVESDSLEVDDEMFQLPGSCSPEIFQFLLALCRELHRAGSHLVESEVVEALQKEAFSKLSQILQRSVESTRTQDGDKEGQILQLLFDCRFAAAVLDARRANEVSIAEPHAIYSYW